MEDDELILHKFDQKLQQLRKNQSLTLQELEAIVDIDNSNLSKYESGSIDIRLTSLYKLSKALGITLSKLFEGIEYHTINQIFFISVFIVKNFVEANRKDGSARPVVLHLEGSGCINTPHGDTKPPYMECTSIKNACQ